MKEINKKENKMKLIVHIAPAEKFMAPLIDFVNKNFDRTKHFFIILGTNDNKNKMYNLNVERTNIVFLQKDVKDVIKLELYMNKAKKIVIHGLFSKYLVNLFFVQPWLLKKSYWVIWGGDLYFPDMQSWTKKQIIKRIGHFVTYIKGDYELAKKWYGAKGNYHECFMYPSNLYKEYDVKLNKHSSINIQIGNSADPTNNHLEILNKLEKYKDENIKIFTPLSYGDMAYANEIAKKGKEKFGDKFIPLTEFMPFDKYLEFLGEIDIAIFAHKRQQAMGNTITLLGLGKKVYMRSDVTPWQLFKDLGVKVFGIEDIDLDLLDEPTKQRNRENIKAYFSKERYFEQLKNLFEDK